MDGKWLMFAIFLLMFFQQPALTANIVLNKSLYQLGETIEIQVVVENRSSTKECIKLLEVTCSDPYSVFWSESITYAVDAECLDPDSEKVYTFWCDIPVHVSEGKGTVNTVVKTWSDIQVAATEFFEIGVNNPPRVILINYPPVISPVQDYELTFSVSDNFGVEDITLVEVSLFAGNQRGKVSPRTGYGFTWDPSNAYTVWESTSPVQVQASLHPEEITWTLTLQVSEIAMPGEWILSITAYDAHHKHHTLTEKVIVTRYLSFHVEDTSQSGTASINFGKASPGEELRQVPLTVVVTSNAQVTVSVEAGDLFSPEGWVLPADQFSVETKSGSIQLKKTRQILYSGYGTEGYNDKVPIILLFSGKLPEVLEAGTYSGVWYIVIEVE